ncbi:GNAT family N-acetyltransferase [Salininema proteolyticum]|uniref:GNAT family N-acetyltransferase n=1 Tax=Salininema proteolyticum TaxID=1607685 RepID=A0ABV8U1N8_9ACTN
MNDNSRTSPFLPKPTLKGALTTLEPATLDHLPDLAEAVSDPEVDRLTGTHATFTTGQLEKWYGSRADQDDRADFAIVDNETGRAVGETVLNGWDEDNRSASFRTFIGAKGRGRGLGTEATALTVDYGFRTIGLNRIGLEVYAFNPRAIHVYEKVGFVREGVLRQALRWEGEWVDAIVMSVLSEAWTARVTDMGS